MHRIPSFRILQFGEILSQPVIPHALREFTHHINGTVTLI